MAIHNAQKKGRIYLGTKNVKKAYLGPIQVYSSGNIVTYNVNGATYQEEVDEGASCLNPTTFTPTKSGWTFLGWRLDNSQNHNVLGSLNMEGSPVTLYATFYRSQSTSMTKSKDYSTGTSSNTQTLTNQYAYNVSVTGHLNATSEHVDYRCDAAIIINGSTVDSITSYENTVSKDVGKYGLGPYLGITVELRIHPHANDKGGGSIRATISYYEISVG